MTRKECKGCDVQFVALRSDAVTCSPRCRKRYQRMCDQINAEMQRQRARKAPPASSPASGPAEGWLTVECRACGIRRSGAVKACPVCLGRDYQVISPDMV